MSGETVVAEPARKSTLSVSLTSYGGVPSDFPVKLEVFDAAFRPVVSRWAGVMEQVEFDVSPGVYIVRASVASGGRVEEAVDLTDGNNHCNLNLRTLSPHETQEWAYFSKAQEPPGESSLQNQTFRGAWIRLWKRQENGTWTIESFPQVANGESHADGVSFSVLMPDQNLYAVQIQGPEIASKIVAVPSTYSVMVLLRPVAEANSDLHPLDVIVSSEDWSMESFLSYMRSGVTEKADHFMNRDGGIAEQMLYEKISNPVRAAVGGYYLLNIGDLERIHGWAENLSNWFQWMPDGPIIRAWQLLLEAGRNPTLQADHFQQARERLLEATRRGFPLFTEGLRRLRDGLLLLDRLSEQHDTDVRRALLKVGAYTASADWSSTATTFLAAHPDPDDQTVTPEQVDQGARYYIYDVPISDMVAAGAVMDGQQIVAPGPKGNVFAKVTLNGLQLADGQAFQSFGQMQQRIPGIMPWQDWTIADNNLPLHTALKGLLITEE